MIEQLQPQHQASRIIAATTQTARRLDEQQSGNLARFGEAAAFRRQHAGMADHAALGWRRLNGIAVERIPKSLARHIAPEGTQLLGGGVVEVFSRDNPAVRQLALHPPANARNILQWYFEQRRWHDVRRPDGHAVRLLDRAGDFGEVAIGRKADGAGDRRADIIADGLLDPPGKAGRITSMVGIETAGQLVNGFDRIDRQHRGNFGYQRIMGAAIEVRLLRHQYEIAANPFGVLHHHDVFDAARLCLLAARDDAGASRPLIGHYADRTPPQARVALLLYARKEAVKVEIEMLNGLWLAHRFRRFGKGSSENI